MLFHNNTNIKSLDGEIWKDIPGYNGDYQASNLGRIKTLKKAQKPKILKQMLGDNRPYLRVKLCKNNKMKMIEVHRLIAMTFIDNPNNKKCVDHINENKLDNRVTNLRWVTHAENLEAHRLKSIEDLKNKLVIFEKNNRFGGVDSMGFNFAVGGDKTYKKAVKKLETTAYGLSLIVKGKTNKKHDWRIATIKEMKE